MLVKLIGSIIIVVTASALGAIYAKSKADRVRQLNGFISAFNMLEVEIGFALSLLPEAFMKIAKIFDRRIGEIFEYVSKMIVDSKINASEAWNIALEKGFPNLSLSGEDKEALRELGSSLGEVDAESQIKNIRLIIERLKKHMINAEEDKQKSEKLFKNLGVISGLAILLILF
jgi:stage III sporulation protein AB